MSEKPALQTSNIPNKKDIENTDNATHVYVTVDNPTGLACRFEGPYPIISRPSRSQVQVRVGSFASGLPRLLTFHWSLCKVAHLREGAPESSRPNIGRKKKNPDATALSGSPDATGSVGEKMEGTPSHDKNKQTESPAKIQTPGRADFEDSSRSPLGPIVTREMFNKWTPENFPELRRSARSTRNPNPAYIEAVAA